MQTTMQSFISTDLLPFIPTKKKSIHLIDTDKFNYNKPQNEIEQIKNNSTINNFEKIDLIKDLLVSKYGIIDGNFSYYLAILTLGDKKHIKAENKRLKKCSKKIIKKKKLIKL